MADKPILMQKKNACPVVHVQYGINIQHIYEYTTQHLQRV